MNREFKRLLQNNNKAEEKIYDDNNKIYSDMIVYLRGSDMTEYNQELVRQDLIQMILDGQERGDDIQKVIGNNYKEICDEIIEAMPKKTTKEKVSDILELTFSATWIMGAIFIVKAIVENFWGTNNNWRFILSVGNIINMVMIIITTNVVVNYTCKTAFNNEKKNKVFSFIKTWIACILIFSIIFLSQYYLKYVIVNISIVLAIVIVAIVFVVNRIVSNCCK